ncbi:hypothetical protein ACOMHN_052871 [Nucella lapillus]
MEIDSKMEIDGDRVRWRWMEIDSKRMEIDGDTVRWRSMEIDSKMEIDGDREFSKNHLYSYTNLENQSSIPELATEAADRLLLS